MDSEFNQNHPSQHSHLFTVRVWLEDLGKGQVEPRGKVKHVLSGETLYFRDWSTLVTHLQTVLARLDRKQTSSEKRNELA